MLICLSRPASWAFIIRKLAPGRFFFFFLFLSSGRSSKMPVHTYADDDGHPDYFILFYFFWTEEDKDEMRRLSEAVDNIPGSIHLVVHTHKPDDDVPIFFF